MLSSIPETNLYPANLSCPLQLPSHSTGSFGPPETKVLSLSSDRAAAHHYFFHVTAFL